MNEWKCGKRSSNRMSTGETKSFLCEPDAIGSVLIIQIPGEYNILTMCEVYIYGEGTVELSISFTIDTRRKYTD